MHADIADNALPIRPSGMLNQSKALNCGIVISLVLHGAVIACLLVTHRSPAQPAPIALMASIVKTPMVESLSRRTAQVLHKQQARQTHAPVLSLPTLPDADKPAAPANVDWTAEPVTTASAKPADSMPAITHPRFDAAYLNNPTPPYPPMARRKGEQGKVLLSVTVKADGSAARIEVRNSSGYPRLDQSAIDTVKSWRFVPGRVGSDNIESDVLVPLTFRLES